jgi:POT family proton-dependent oligopeptide transporter
MKITKAGMPKGVPYIVCSELAEKFSFFGMRSILSIFLVHQFFNPHGLRALDTIAEAKSNAYTHAFSSLVFFTPFLGAILADWYLGKYRLILIGSVVYAFGHFILAISASSLAGFASGMMIIALAAGAIKSCVSANVGDQFTHSNQHLISKAYGWFYFSVNLGGTISILLIPVLYDHFGPAVAFGLPGILMTLATVIFYLGKKHYVQVPPTGIKKANFLTINFFALRTFIAGNKSQTVWQHAEAKFGAEKVDAVKAIYRAMAVFVFIPVFWALYDMSQSEWVLQADKLNLSLGIAGIKLLASQVQVANTIFILLMIPLCNYVVFPLLKKAGIRLSPLRKIGAGLFITALSFIIIAMLQTRIQNGSSPSVWWQILAYMLLSMAEVLVAVTGLEYAYTQSPPSIKSTMTAIWFLAYSIGTFFTTIININIAHKGLFSYFTGDRYFYLFAGIMLFFFALFLLVSPFIKEKAYLSDHLSEGG